MSQTQSALPTYAMAFLASISLFGMVDANHGASGIAAAVTQAYLLPVLGIAAAMFLALTVMLLARAHLRPQSWTSEAAERRLRDIGLAAICYFGLLALLGYVCGLIAPDWFGGVASTLTRFWPWLLALPCLALGAQASRNKPGWLTAGAVFVTMGFFAA
ncbi:hypothetical protein [Paracoccus shanxieyensis]|uniref:Uncharacterized protein n=1 Tax=Paracoccus shanxieyensis TaxID=2675752 RepID=A0A6L6IWK4_9RHOB|nr:hypothetical protein [Paracoccus shanxieyensis]MTH62757.1 hypothetical protein [Paracoccus shanxieyensis]MTH86159.1 hypothetical protein [Paracoccus shanxieyensis]